MLGTTFPYMEMSQPLLFPHWGMEEDSEGKRMCEGDESGRLRPAILKCTWTIYLTYVSLG